nr:Retrovirus-related Pol polyprotein from transposon TNT 1-94 [Ipomoea batatas]
MSVTDVSCQDIPSPINQPTSHIPREQLNTPLDDKLPSTVAVGDINRRANASFTSFKPNVQDGDTPMQTTTQLPGLVQGVVEESSMGGGNFSSPNNAHFLGNFSSPGGSYSLSPEYQQLGDNFGVENSTSSYMSSNGQDDRMPYDSSSPTHDGEPIDSGGPVCSDDSHSQSLVQPHNAEVVPTLQRSTRHRVPPSYLKDYHCNLIYGDSSNSCIQVQGTPHCISKVVVYDHLSSSHKNFVLASSCVTEPTSYNEAVKHECWREAMRAELEALDVNKTWVLTDLPLQNSPLVVNGFTR